MSRKRKRKKQGGNSSRPQAKASANKGAATPQPSSPKEETKQPESSASAQTQSPPVALATPETPFENWPALEDPDPQTPLRFPYDHGGIPLGLLLLYMAFLSFALLYMSNWLVPDLMSYFFQ